MSFVRLVNQFYGTSRNVRTSQIVEISPNYDGPNIIGAKVLLRDKSTIPVARPVDDILREVARLEKGGKA